MINIYPWQESEWRRLFEMQEHNRLPHALLLCGSEGIGLKQFAQAFAMQRLCLSQDKTSDNPCGTCQSCQLYLAGNHPDLNIIEPEEAGKQIKIAQVRELIDYVSLKSFSGKQKIAIIEPADAMNRATSNALLKTLEEPPAQSMLLLLSHRPSKLPITIRSRCQRIDFKPADRQIATDWLRQKIDGTEISSELLLRLSDGGPLKALEIAESDQLQQRQSIMKDLSLLTRRNADAVQIASNWQDFGCENVLTWLLRLTQDLIRLKLLQDKANLLNFDMKEDLQDLVKTLDLPALVRNYDFVQNKYQELVGPMNFNALSILEEVIVHWLSPENNAIK